MKIDKIIDPEFKTGTTEKNGKKFTWTMMKVEAGGREATGFGPVVVGDEVDLTYNEKYRNYSFKLLKEGEIPSHDINEDIESPKVETPTKTDGDNKYLKDATTVPLDVYRVRANVEGLPLDSAQRKTFFKNVRLDALHLLKLIDEVRDGTFEEKTSETAPAKATGREKFTESVNKLKGEDVTNEYGEEDIPDFEG